jgi:serine/threonine-protein kinase HipA
MARAATTTVGVYAAWEGLPDPLRLGLLHAHRGTGREVFEFEFGRAALAHPSLANLQLDARLGLFEGRQHPPQGRETFGVFADASPDRWGRLLMRRRVAAHADRTRGLARWRTAQGERGRLCMHG